MKLTKLYYSLISQIERVGLFLYTLSHKTVCFLIPKFSIFQAEDASIGDIGTGFCRFLDKFQHPGYFMYLATWFMAI